MDSSLMLRLGLMYPTATEVPDLTRLTDNDEIDKHEHAVSSTEFRDFLANFRSGETAHWQIDGGAEGSRYFAVPDFVRGQPPLRIDVYVPEFARSSHPMFHSADLDSTFSASSSQAAESSAESMIVHILNQWSSRYAGFQDTYCSLPYGSYILLGNVEGDLSQATVDMIPNFAVERAWMPIDSLLNMWDLPKSLWPPIVGWDRLQLERQIHENITLVRLHSSNGSSELLVYKSVLQDLQHFYHETKILLKIPPHPNVLAKPRYIVTKKCRFGSKIGVCGILLDFHSGGTLQQALRGSIQNDPQRSPQLRRNLSWARQLVSASIHVHKSVGFYANMKLINVVMSPGQYYAKPVLVDFEQRSGRFSWSPPEVHYIDFIEQLAVNSENDSTRARYTSLLQKLIPEWKQLSIRARYDNPKDGYSTAWLIMNEAERESAQVYMLGKLLWCIFEQAPAISSCITPETFREPPCSQLFPTCSRTPRVLRKCIQQCTIGAPEWDERWPPVFRIGRRLHKINFAESGTRPTEVDLVDIQRASKTWWAEEIKRAEHFIEAKARRQNGEPEQKGDSSMMSFSGRRPKLKDLLEIFETMERGPDVWIS